MKRLALAVILTVAVSGSAFGHAGSTFFAPSVPDPSAVTVDGSEDDWGWYDREFAVLPDQIQAWAGAAAGLGPGEQAEDYSATYFMAWSLPPDNNLYFFARAFDDTLSVQWADNKRNWWDDDTFMIGFDSDHTGGSILVNENIEEAQNGYRIVVNSVGSNELGVDMGGMLGTDANPTGDWGGFPPYAEVATTILPAGADHGSENVEYGYELKMAVWDSYDPEGPDGGLNLRHEFTPDRIIHASVRLNDVDMVNDAGTRNQYGYAGGASDGQADGEQGTDVITVLTHDPSTAVENSTWGRIKSHQENALR